MMMKTLSRAVVFGIFFMLSAAGAARAQDGAPASPAAAASLVETVDVSTRVETIQSFGRRSPFPPRHAKGGNCRRMEAREDVGDAKRGGQE